MARDHSGSSAMIRRMWRMLAAGFTTDVRTGGGITLVSPRTGSCIFTWENEAIPFDEVEAQSASGWQSPVEFTVGILRRKTVVERASSQTVFLLLIKTNRNIVTRYLQAITLLPLLA